MGNAKLELLKIVKNTSGIKCAAIELRGYGANPNIILKLTHSEIELASFLNSLDFEYDNGYGGQELYGTVWLKDGTWMTRGEYDGSEWWDHNVLPSIPDYCLAEL